MRLILIMAMAGLREGIRNRWIIASVLLLLILAVSLMLMGSAPVGLTSASLLSVTTVSLTSLSIYLVPLIALMLSYDAIVGESDRGTLLLLLTYPIRRWQILVGKFLGHLCILAIAIGLGYGLVAVYFAVQEIGSRQEWLAYFSMMGSTLLLGAIFITLGYLVSVIVQQRATAIGLCLGLWLVIVVFYDLILLGILLADSNHAVSSDMLATLILFNPADVYRLFNLAGTEVSAMVSGLTGLTGSGLLSPVNLILVMLAWLIVPVALGIALFRKREV